MIFNSMKNGIADEGRNSVTRTNSYTFIPRMGSHKWDSIVSGIQSAAVRLIEHRPKWNSTVYPRIKDK